MYVGRLRSPPQNPPQALSFTPTRKSQAKLEDIAAARTMSGFSKAMVQIQGTRSDLEDESKVMKQCEAVLPPINTFAQCWLCTFPVGHTSFLKYLQSHGGSGIIPIQSLDFAAWTYKKVKSPLSETGEKRVRKDPNNDIFDRATCEHVLPIKLAVGTLGLAAEQGVQKALGLDVHAEYEYAHNYCNYVKNKSYFVSIPLDQTNFDNMTINHDKVNLFVDTLIYVARGENATFMDGRVKINGTLFANIVQAYLFLFKKDIQTYKATLIKAITERTQRMIDHIKAIDKASRLSDGSSSFYNHFKNTVAGLNTEARQQQQAFLTKLQEVAPHYLSAGTVPLQRSPSSAVCQTYQDCMKGFTFNDDMTVSYLENKDLDISSGFPKNTAMEKYYAIKDSLYLQDPSTGARFLVEDIDDSAQGGRRNRRHKKTQRKRRIHKKRRTTHSKK